MGMVGRSRPESGTGSRRRSQGRPESRADALFPAPVAREYTDAPMAAEKIGLIAGNGSFPLLVLDAARARGLDVVVAAIREETFPEIEQHGALSVHWLSLENSRS